MFGKLTAAAAVQMLVFGLGLGLIPLLLGLVLGFGAFVVTPVVFVLVAIGLGFFAVAKSARRAPWTEIALCTLSSLVPMPVVFLGQAVSNGSFSLGPTLIGVAYYSIFGLITAALLALGALLGGAWRPPKTPQPEA